MASISSNETSFEGKVYFAVAYLCAINQLEYKVIPGVLCFFHGSSPLFKVLKQCSSDVYKNKVLDKEELKTMFVKYGVAAAAGTKAIPGPIWVMSQSLPSLSCKWAGNRQPVQRLLRFQKVFTTFNSFVHDPFALLSSKQVKDFHDVQFKERYGQFFPQIIKRTETKEKADLDDLLLKYKISYFFTIRDDLFPLIQQFNFFNLSEWQIAFI